MLRSNDVYPRIFKKRAFLYDGGKRLVCLPIRSYRFAYPGPSLNEDVKPADVNLFGILGRYAFDNFSLSLSHSFQACRSGDTRWEKLITSHGNPGDSLSLSYSINGISHKLILSVFHLLPPTILAFYGRLTRSFTKQVLTFFPCRYTRTQLPSFCSLMHI